MRLQSSGGLTGTWVSKMASFTVWDLGVTVSWYSFSIRPVIIHKFSLGFLTWWQECLKKVKFWLRLSLEIAVLFSPHSFGQIKSSCELKCKGWENRLHLYWREVQQKPTAKGYCSKEIRFFRGPCYKVLPWSALWLQWFSFLSHANHSLPRHLKVLYPKTTCINTQINNGENP